MVPQLPELLPSPLGRQENLVELLEGRRGSGAIGQLVQLVGGVHGDEDALRPALSKLGPEVVKHARLAEPGESPAAVVVLPLDLVVLQDIAAPEPKSVLQNLLAARSGPWKRATDGPSRRGNP